MSNFQDNSNSYFVALTSGAIRNGYISVRDHAGFFPPEFIANEEGVSESQFTLCWPDGEEHLTCVLSKFGRIKARFTQRFTNYTAPVTLRITKDPERKDRFHISKQSPEASKVTTDSKDMKDDDKLGARKPLNQILYGPPGTGKTYSTTLLSVSLADPYWFEKLQTQGWGEDQKRTLIKARYEELCSDGRIELTTFHQSFSYEDFVEGIRAQTSQETKSLEYKIENGVFKRMCVRADNAISTNKKIEPSELPISVNSETSRSTVSNYVLIIDEINRGNISRIFGELITLLEPDKREGGSDARSVILPYSKEPFNVPSNLYVVGTMNTADKSLAQLDLALRRRFEFVELMPEPTLLSGVSVHGLDIGELLNLLNQRIEVLLDRDHMLGHAYFWPLKGVDSESEKEMLLADIFAKRVIPLLQEYFFSDWERIAWVLNDPGKALDAQFIQTKDVGLPMSHLFADAIADEVIDRRYRINQQAFTNPDSYKGIFNVVGE